MDVPGESVRGPLEGQEGLSDESARAPLPEDPLPDLLALDLAELRTIQHPVLSEVLEDLRERAARPSEMLWGFNDSSF